MRLPQRHGGWDIDNPAGQSESDCASLADREKVDDNSCSKFVDFEGVGRGHGGVILERRREFVSIRRKYCL